MPKKISTKCNVFLQLINIASASAFYPSRLQKKSAKPSAFYTFENPHVRRSANPHFTRGRFATYKHGLKTTTYPFLTNNFASRQTGTTDT